MKVDARNVACPKPVVMTIRALDTVEQGDTVEVLVNEDVAVENIKRMAAQKGYPFSVKAGDGEWELAITKEENAAACPAAEEILKKPAVKENEVIAIGTNQMGQGDEQLGHILIKSYIYALAQQEILPATVIFFNSGAYLTCEGSESLEDLTYLESLGVRIVTCGTCADYYKLKDKVKVGIISNMYAIAEYMQKADKVVRI